LQKILNLQHGNKILVFCFAGMSRSTSSVLTYLILKKKLDLREALKTVKSNRDVLPSAQNLAHLTKMFNADRGLGTVEENVEEYETARYRQLSQGKTF
jgi:protein-tyrosine phosphatase